MRIRTNKNLGIIYIVTGLMFGCFAIIISAATSKSNYGFAGAAFAMAVFGVLLTRGTYFEVNNNTLILHALIGPMKTEYKFNSPKDITIEGKKFFVQSEAKRTQIPISKWLADKKDMEAFLQWIDANKKT